MRAPEELFTVHRDVVFDDPPILVYAFSGFVDAGGGVRLAAEHILASCQHQLVATFDVDELLDYRARRPKMTYVVDHFASVEVQQIVLHEVTDATGQQFLLLTGPEPDYQWMRFMAAIDILVGPVRRATRDRAVGDPVAHPAHPAAGHHRARQRAGTASPATCRSSARSRCPGTSAPCWSSTWASRGVPSMGVTAQVPHYLVQFEFPRAASTLLAGVSAATGLALPVADLEPAARRADAEVAQQLEGNDEFATVVSALEQQYDQMAAITSGATGGLGDLAD